MTTPECYDAITKEKIENIYKAFPEYHFIVVAEDENSIAAYKTWKEASEAIRANPGCSAFSLVPLDPRAYAQASHGEDAWKLFTRGKMPTFERKSD